MNIKKLVGAGIVAGALAVSSVSVAGAAVIFDPDTGTGFAGKGDVQLVYGWNNKDLQANAASVQFQYVATATTVSEVSWVCTNTNNESIRGRQRTTTTTTETSGVVTTVARERNQITGFNLAGYTSLTQSSSSETEGPQLNSCPSGPWVLSEPAGAPMVDEDASTSEGGLQVSIDGTNWSDI